MNDVRETTDAALPEHAQRARSKGYLAGWLCAVALLVCVAASDPRLEMGFHDDWSYIYSAMVLAKTGHVVYNGWATAMLGWQLYLGAAFIKLFGFSFTVVRASNLLVALISVPLIHRILTRLGISQWNATVATLTFVLSPVYMPLSFSFMSDLPSLLVLLLCLYGCMRAVEAETASTALAWLAAAAVMDVLGGTVRQIAWLGALVMVPSTGWYLRHRKGVAPFTLALWLVSLAAIFGFIHWFNHQPYVAVEGLIPMHLNAVGAAVLGRALLRSSLTVPLLVLPVLLGFAVHFPFEKQTPRRSVTTILILLAILIGAGTFFHGGVRWMAMLMGPYMSRKGILDGPGLLGTRPDVFPNVVGALIVLLVFSILAVFAGWAFCELRPGRMSGVLRGHVFWLLGPFSAAYLFLVLTRVAIFDRYLLPLIFVLLIVLLRLYERRVGGRLAMVCIVPVILVALYSVAGTHDLYTMERARLRAANELIARGVPRTEFRAGFEYDGWTQIQTTGFVNEPRIRIPANAYKPISAPPGTPYSCLFPFFEYWPSIHPRYELSYEQNVCFPAAPFQPVSYKTLLPPHDRAIYILQVR